MQTTKLKLKLINLLRIQCSKCCSEVCAKIDFKQEFIEKKMGVRC